MIMTRERIYSYVESAVNTDGGVYCSSRYEPVPSEFPACYITEADHHPNKSDITLNFDDEQYVVTYEVQVYSNKTNGAVEEAYDIMSRAEAAFKRMSFIETYCNHIGNIDPSVERVVARFSRKIGGADEMPT